MGDGRGEGGNGRARAGEPLRELRRRVCVVIVEVRARREYLDGIKAVGGNVDKMLAAQPRLVEQVRGDAEAVVRQPLIIATRRGVRPAARAAGRIADGARYSHERS